MVECAKFEVFDSRRVLEWAVENGHDTELLKFLQECPKNNSMITVFP